MAQLSNQEPADRVAQGCCTGLDELLSTRFFKALCDPSRLSILTQLANTARPTTVSEVAGCCPVDLSVVSRHLKTLFDAGIVSAERSGREVRYTVRFTEVARTLRAIADAIEACCPPTAPSCCDVVCAAPADPASPPSPSPTKRTSPTRTATRDQRARKES